MFAVEVCPVLAMKRITQAVKRSQIGLRCAAN